MICAGKVYRATLTVGDGKTPANTAVLTVTLPDQTTVTPIVVNNPPGSGQYYADYTLPVIGFYKFAWHTTQPDTSPIPDFISVRDYRSLVSFAETRAHLQKTSTVTDDELSAFMMAATELVEAKAGTCVPTQFTERVEQGRWQLVLSQRPILSVASVTSIWPGGPAWPGSVLGWDAEAALVYQLQPFDFWWGPWDVVATAGRPVIAERFIHAAKEQIRHLWETQRGGQPPALLQGEQEFTTTTGWTFTVPRRVLELLEADVMPAS
jgi:hypothetical protein